MPAPEIPHIPDHDLLRRIGRGSYGEVWLARNVMGAWRAVKIVRRDGFSSERPYEREFEGIRKFEPISRMHDSQVDILHVGQDQAKGIFYYVMELADDARTVQDIDPETYSPRTLASELAEKKRLPAKQCLETGLALATALEHLHSHGLIHRDIKPANIIFVHGRAKLADIGLVADATQDMSFVGTEGYVPIEGPGSAQADIFGLGRVLYEINTGLSQQQFPDIPSSFGLDEEDADLARELNLIVNKACARRAEDRHPSAAALREELLLLQSGYSIRRVRENERRVRALRWFGAVAAVVALFAGVGYFSALRANVRADANFHTAQENLAAARLAQAKSLHASDRAERRAEGLAAIAEAARIKPSRALRDEALALLPAMEVGPAIPLANSVDGFTPNMRRPLRARPSPDGQLCAWLVDKNDLVITNTADGRELARLPGVGKNARAVEWSPCGRYVAAGTLQRALVWDWKAGKVLINKEFERSDAVAAAAFSANGERVALCVGEKVALFSCATGEEIVVAQSALRQTAFAVHPNGDLFGSVGPGGGTLWSATSKAEVMGQELPKGTGANFSFRHIAWSADGNLVAGVLTDGALIVFNVGSGKIIMRVAHAGVPGNVAFSPDSALLITSSADDGTRLWDTRGGILRVASIPDAFGLQFSADSQSVVFATATGFETRNITHQPGLCLPIRSAGHRMEVTTFSPDGRLLLAMGDKHSTADLWDVRTGKKAGTFGGLFAGDRELGWAGFTRDGRTLLAVGNTGLVSSSVEIRDGALSLGWPATKALPLPCEPGNAGDTSPDGKRLLVRANGEVFFVCDLAEPEKARAVTLTQNRISGLSWSADGRRIAVSNSRGGPIIYDAATLLVIRTLGTRAGKATFSPSGKLLALVTSGSCDLLDATTFERVKSFERHPLENLPGETAFSGDGAFLAMTQDGRRVDLIDVAKLENVASFEPPASSRANRLQFSPDGSTLVLHDADNAYLFNLPELRRSLAAMGLDW